VVTYVQFMFVYLLERNPFYFGLDLVFGLDAMALALVLMVLALLTSLTSCAHNFVDLKRQAYCKIL